MVSTSAEPESRDAHIGAAFVDATFESAFDSDALAAHCILVEVRMALVQNLDFNASLSSPDTSSSAQCSYVPDH